MNPYIKKVPLESISDDNTYRYSYRKASDDLINSIESVGVLKAPVLLNDRNRLVIVDGFNRIEALKALYKKDVLALVWEEFVSKDFVHNIFQKHYDTSLSPSERLGFMHLCSKVDFLAEGLDQTATKWMGIPDTFIHDLTIFEVFNSLNSEFRIYLDTRAISFKILQELCGLPRTLIDVIASWVSQCDFRVNFFKTIVELVDDIYRMNNKIEILQSFTFNKDHDNRTREQTIYDFLMAIRYPEYVNRREEVGNLLKQINVKGIFFNYDNNFETNRLELKMHLNKKNSIDDIKTRLGSINPAVIDKIIALL